MSSQEGKGRAADFVVEAVETLIHSGELADGQPLPPERDLMEAYRVSRTVVREAVRVLSSRGLVEARPRFRPVVRKPGFDTALDAVGGIVAHMIGQPNGVKNLFETRAMVEVALARQAATDATKDGLARLKEALEANKQAINDSELFYETDTAFHAVLYTLPNNPVLPALHMAYQTWLAPQWTRMPRLPDRNQRNYEAHCAIYDAILMRDPDAAEAAMKAHLSNAWHQVRATFGDI